MARKRSVKRSIQRVDVTWYGDDFLDIIERYGDEALFEAGRIVLEAATSRAPRGRGKLRMGGYISTKSRSTYVRRGYWRKEKKPPANAVTIAFSAPHSHLIEGGRRSSGTIAPRKRQALRVNGKFVSRSRYGRVAAKPFLGPALEATRTTMVEELAGVLRKRLEGGMPKGR